MIKWFVGLLGLLTVLSACIVVIVGAIWILNLEITELTGMDFAETYTKKILGDKYVKKEKECIKHRTTI